MRGHRCTAFRVETESDTESDPETMRCLSCKKEYCRCDAGTCRECCEEESETEGELKGEIEHLEAKVASLRFWSHLDHHPRHLNHRSFSTGPCFTDVVLFASSDDGPAASSVPVPAHKAVLVSRSSVFKAMLENEMEESRSGTIEISDVSYDALLTFVNYLYTAEACLDEQKAYDLLDLAEKYQVEHLKAYCEKFLVSELNLNNSVVCYTFAHLYNAKQLLEAALSLIIDNRDKVIKGEEYKQLEEMGSQLVAEIHEAYMRKQVNTAPTAFTSSLQRLPTQTQPNTSPAESDSGTMRCISCKKEYSRCDAGTCRKCYETKKELKSKVEDLKAKVAFLPFWSPFNHHINHRSCFADVSFVACSVAWSAGPREVPAHKAVLVSRSSVFKAMLENEMEESWSGTIEISEVSYDALLTFVNYLYTAEACLDEQKAKVLVKLAEKYQVEHLKAYCQKFLGVDEPGMLSMIKKFDELS